MDAVRVGKAIKLLRIKNGLTQSELAKLINVTDKAVSKWERGIGIPDISLITKLAFVLNVDVNNILEGNVYYLAHEWKGVLICGNYGIKNNIYGKPSVYFSIGYFILAGIKDIYIYSNYSDLKYLKDQIGDGKQWGIRIYYYDKENEEEISNKTMVVYNVPFIYGQGLTRYFQRAMSNNCDYVLLTIPYNNKFLKKNRVTIDDKGFVRKTTNSEFYQLRIPIFFVHRIRKKCKVINLEELIEEEIKDGRVGSVSFGNGMIFRDLVDANDILEVSNFVRFIEESSGKEIYNLKEIAGKRFTKEK